MQSKLTFWGGAGSVTGSSFMLDVGEAQFLIDCGFEQGSKDKEDANYKPFAYDVSKPMHLFVSHAHIDHIGRIPFIVKEGFKGRVVSTHATRDLAAALLHDAQAIEASESEREGRKPLYEPHDIDVALKQWDVRGLHEPMELAGGMAHEFLDAGHILGSAMSKFTRGGKTLVVTGDLGAGNSPLLSLTEPIVGTDYLVVESVYGDVERDDTHRQDKLEKVIKEITQGGGSVLIPAFSTERTQDLLYEIRLLMHEGKVPQVPVYLDSPLAEEITAAYERNSGYFAPAIRARMESGEKIFEFPQLTFSRTVEDSARIKHDKGPKIIMAGSGMSSGGRVRSHYTYMLPNERNTLLIVGYQAAGTLGRRILEGAKSIQIHGEVVPVRAKVLENYGYSAHKDSTQLLEFVEGAQKSLQQVFVVEGEPASAGFLTQRIRDYLGLNAQAPSAGDSADIEL
jgi:metallo-beta-lactamase family protein